MNYTEKESILVAIMFRHLLTIHDKDRLKKSYESAVTEYLKGSVDKYVPKPYTDVV